MKIFGVRIDEVRKYLIIGGVAGGVTTAARLRRLDEKSEIIVFERGEYISYANCGLPYYIGYHQRQGSTVCTDSGIFWPTI
jgi:NADPH-dependent 2,4-dienoyl-CoA reductase/sulfur reductase-like enzyme